jgi:hypothetical protein
MHGPHDHPSVIPPAPPAPPLPCDGNFRPPNAQEPRAAARGGEGRWGEGMGRGGLPEGECQEGNSEQGHGEAPSPSAEMDGEQALLDTLELCCATGDPPPRSSLPYCRRSAGRYPLARAPRCRQRRLMRLGRAGAGALPWGGEGEAGSGWTRLCAEAEARRLGSFRPTMTTPPTSGSPAPRCL